MNLEKSTSKYIGHRLWTKFFLALLPLVAIIAAGQNNPLLFMILLAAGHILGNLIFLKLKFKNAFRDELYKRIGVNFFKFKIKCRNESTGQSKNSSSLNIFRENSILARTQGVGIMFLVWSFLFINSVVAVVIFESWPLFHEIIIRRRKKQYNQSENNIAFSRLFLFTVLGLASLILVLFSDTSFRSDDIIIVALLFLGGTFFSLQGKLRAKQGEVFSRVSSDPLDEYEREFLSGVESESSVEKLNGIFARVRSERLYEEERDAFPGDRSSQLLKELDEAFSLVSSNISSEELDEALLRVSDDTFLEELVKAKKLSGASSDASLSHEIFSNSGDELNKKWEWLEELRWELQQASSEEMLESQREVLEVLKVLRWLKDVKKGEIEAKSKLAEKLKVAAITHLLAACVTFILGLSILGIFEVFNLFQGFSGRISLGGMVLAVVAGITLSFAKNWQQEIKLRGKTDLLAKGAGYLIPIMSVGLLCSFIAIDNVFNFIASDLPSLVDIKWSWFVIGFLGIFSVNLLAILKSEGKRLGVTSLIAALLVAGDLIFFRDNWSWWENEIDSQEVGNFGYFAFVGVSATIFALLVGFAISRIQERTQNEEKLAFSLLRRLENLPPREGTDHEQFMNEYRGGEIPSYEALVKKLDKATDSATIADIYHRLLSSLEELSSPEELLARKASISKENIREATVEIDLLSHSKQYGRRVGETLAIVILGMFIVGLSISFRPTGVLGLSVILIDILSFLLVATVVYLIFHQYELRADRGNSSITEQTSNPGVRYSHKFSCSAKKRYYVRFQEATFRDEVVVTTVLIFLVVATFTAIFFLKWLLWM